MLIIIILLVVLLFVPFPTTEAVMADKPERHPHPAVGGMGGTDF